MRYDLFCRNTKRNGTIVDPHTTTVIDRDMVKVEDAMVHD